MRRLAVVIATAFLPRLSVHAAPSPNPRTSTASATTVKWLTCPKDIPSTVECGQILVPIDHANPYGELVPLIFTRLRSTSNSTTAPGLYVETGGPGAPNTVVPISAATALKTDKGMVDAYAELLSVYDLIGLDMRGTGSSVPVRCDPNTINAVTWPIFNGSDQSSYKDMVSRSRAFGESCLNMTGPLFFHMGTDQAIQDLDLLREALGHDKLNYLGWSYGTQFGSEYAEMFPDKVGRMVLDGVYDRHLSLETYLSTAAVGSESVLNDFFRWCNTTTDCALYGRDQATIWDAIAASTNVGTLRAPSCVGGPCVNNGIATPWQFRSHLYDLLHDYNNKDGEHNWYRYAEGLKSAFDDGNGTYFVSGQATLNRSTTDFTLYPQFIINCSDRDRRQLTFEDFVAIYTLTPVLAPHTLGYSDAQQFVSTCSGWPVNSTNPPHDLDPRRMSRLPPIMLVNAFYDPATLSPWGLDMRSQIPTGFSIYRNGGGHTSWSLNGETTQAINAFLVNGTIPDGGTVYQT